MEKELDEVDQVTGRLREEFRRLNANYDATPEQFRQLSGDSNAAMRASQWKLIQIHFQIKELATPQEWKVLSSRERKAFEDTLQAHEKQASSPH